MIAFHPGRVAIDGYGNGGFRFGGMSHRGSILIVPAGIHGVASAETAEIGAENLAVALAERDLIDLMVFGCGEAAALLPPSVRVRPIADGVRVDEHRRCRHHL